jgi:uroporphyrinogen III methyltransferase/synthase
MRDVLPRALRAAGRDVEVIAAYKTSNVDDPSLARAAEETDVWTFTSASTVLGFIANVPGAGDLAQERTVACIGPVTAETARDAGIPPDVVAERYTVDGLIEALETFAFAR